MQKEIIVITGGAGGIGQACAQAFKDHRIILTDYAQGQVDAAVEKLSKDGFDVSGVACDITDKKDIEKLIQFVSSKGALKALVHTAGVSGTVTDLRKVFTIPAVLLD